MNGKTHKIGGVCAGIITTSMILEPTYSFEKLLIGGFLIGGSILGSLMPDIDLPSSTVGKRVKPISYLIHQFFGHRGITHTPILHILCSIFLLMLGQGLTGIIRLIYLSFVIGLFAGGVSHIILDAMTVKGVPLLYPFTKKKYRIANLVTGQDEMLVQIITIGITVLTIGVSFLF